MEKEKSNVPKLRFSGFTDDWEQRKFSELVIIERGGSPRPIESYITEEENGLNWVKIGDAPEMGNYITKTAQKIKPEGLKKTREVHPGDLILSNSMSFGRPYIMAIDGCIHDGWLLIRDEQKLFDLKFLCALLGTDSMLNQYTAMAAGSTVNNLNKELVGNTTVFYPSLAEQRVIGNFLTKLDEAITLHQRKLDQIKEYKNGMLQKMFPKEGETVPEVRFPGFDGEWEQRKVGDVITEVSRPIEMHDDQLYQLVTVKRRNEGIVSRGFFYGKDILVKNYYEIHKGDYLISKRQLVHGANGLVPVTLDNSIVSNEYMVCVGNEILSAEFLTLLSKTKKLKRDFFLSSYGVDIEKFVFNVNDWKKRSLVLPTVAEQNVICDFFRNLDNLITLQQRKLEELKEYKKGLLQQMFV